MASRRGTRSGGTNTVKSLKVFTTPVAQGNVWLRTVSRIRREIASHFLPASKQGVEAAKVIEADYGMKLTHFTIKSLPCSIIIGLNTVISQFFHPADHFRITRTNHAPFYANQRFGYGQREDFRISEATHLGTAGRTPECVGSVINDADRPAATGNVAVNDFLNALDLGGQAIHMNRDDGSDVGMVFAQ